MPAKSAAQKRLMDAAAHNPAFAKKVGIPSKVAKEYSQASKGQTFKRGGEMKSKKMASGGYTRAADGIASKGKTKGKIVKMAMGGLPEQASARAGQALAARPALPSQAQGVRPFKKGGKACK